MAQADTASISVPETSATLNVQIAKTASFFAPTTREKVAFDANEKLFSAQYYQALRDLERRL
jgi:hypothetical protein